MQFISDKTLQEIESALGLGLVEEERRIDIMRKVIELISGRAGIRIVRGFTEKQAEIFNLIPEENLEEMEEFIVTSNPDALAIFEEEAQKAKTELLGIAVEHSESEEAADDTLI
jgi:hypothetical protein